MTAHAFYRRDKHGVLHVERVELSDTEGGQNLCARELKRPAASLNAHLGAISQGGVV